MRRELYIALRRRLREELPELKHLGLWNENMEDLPRGLLFDTPAVFVEFAPATFSGGGQGVPRAPMEITLHLVHKYTPEEPHEAIEEEDHQRPDYLEDPLSYLDLLERLEAAPIGLSGEGFSGLQLLTSDLDHQHGELMHHWATFVTGVAYPAVPATRERGAERQAVRLQSIRRG